MIVEDLMGLEEMTGSRMEDNDWIDDRSKPEVEFDDEQQRSFEQELSNLRVLEWFNEMTSDPKENQSQGRGPREHEIHKE